MDEEASKELMIMKKMPRMNKARGILLAVIIIAAVAGAAVLSGQQQIQYTAFPETALKTRVELPFCKTVSGCEDQFRNHGSTDDQIAQLQIECVNAVCTAMGDFYG